VRPHSRWIAAPSMLLRYVLNFGAVCRLIFPSSFGPAVLTFVASTQGTVINGAAVRADGGVVVKSML
jgi:hypothetical protein